MRIVDLDPTDEQVLEALARLLVEGFKELAPESWPDVDSAREEVAEALDAERINRVALADDGAVLGWIGGAPEYNGHVWEMHPLVVAPASQGQGVGRALVQDFEAQVAQRGGLTIFLGTDDETNRTTLSNVDLYADVPGRIATAQAVRPHPFAFYQHLGYSIVGVIPDANGRGKPDILMAKHVG